jgi:peptidoglycan/LPS O-acetylase OafA/YrhL
VVDAPVERPPVLRSLLGVRFPAALAVFVFHLHVMGLLTGGRTGQVLDWVLSQGAGGFSFYFILGGFVLAWTWRTTDSPLVFWRRRLARIYPDHLLTFCAAVALTLASGDRIAAGVAVPNLLLFQAWVPDQRVYFGLNIVSWSLACEVLFYALFPLLNRALVALRGRLLWPVLAATLATSWLIPVAARLFGAPERYWLVWVFPLARLPEFCAGMLLARLVRDGAWPAFLRVRLAAGLLVAAYAATNWLPADFRYVAGLVVPLALTIGALGARDAAGRPSRLASPVLLWLAQLSYAFYLVHSLVLRVVLHVAGADRALPGQLALAGISLAVTVVVSWLVFRLWEQPARRRILRPLPATAPARLLFRLPALHLGRPPLAAPVAAVQGGPDPA